MHRVLWSSTNIHYGTPLALYQALDAEFHFTCDPCPLHTWDDLYRLRSWAGLRVFCNPPYGRRIRLWLEKAREAELAVYLLPARTDTAWWHEAALAADEIRFCRGRLHFAGARRPVPFPSVILVYRGPVVARPVAALEPAPWRGRTTSP